MPSEFFILVASIILGVLICGVAITWLLNRHFKKFPTEEDKWNSYRS